MKNYHRLLWNRGNTTLCLCCILLTFLPACDDNGGGRTNTPTTTVTGTVLDIDHNPINGAVITITGNQEPVTTDVNGNFLTKAEVGEHNLVINMNQEEIYRTVINCVENEALALGNIVTSYNPYGNSGPVEGACTFNKGVLELWAILNQRVPPLSEFPAPGYGWQNYIHPSWPPLSFMYPPGWNPVTIAEQERWGVELIRNDREAVFQDLFINDTSGIMDVDYWLYDNLYHILDLLNEPGEIEVRCSMKNNSSPAQGISLNNKAVAITAGNTIIVATITINKSAGVPVSLIGFETLAGPADEYTELAEDVFIPIIYQMLYGHPPIEDGGDGGG